MKQDRIQIYDFVEFELQYFRESCNFSPQELEYFNLRARHKSNVEIALLMHISESQVSKLSKKVKVKIMKTLPFIQ